MAHGVYQQTQHLLLRLSLYTCKEVGLCN